MPRLLLIMFILGLPGVATAQGVAFPNPPAGQVFDPTGWLGEDRILRLEKELGRYRKHHAVDVVVVLWSRGLSPQTTLEDLVNELEKL